MRIGLDLAEVPLSVTGQVIHKNAASCSFRDPVREFALAESFLKKRRLSDPRDQLVTQLGILIPVFNVSEEGSAS